MMILQLKIRLKVFTFAFKKFGTLEVKLEVLKKKNDSESILSKHII